MGLKMYVFSPALTTIHIFSEITTPEGVGLRLSASSFKSSTNTWLTCKSRSVVVFLAEVDFETKEDILIVIVYFSMLDWLVWWVVEWCLKAGLKICYHDLLLAASHFLPDLSYFNIMNAINGHNRAHFQTAPFLRLSWRCTWLLNFYFWLSSTPTLAVQADEKQSELHMW